MVGVLLVNIVLISDDNLTSSNVGRLFHLILIIALLATAVLWVRDRHNNQK
ncbi:hypothetical protein [Apilactobacillus apinorum]|uniref:hypothetical protein n=1 Tax=Apilactobacillus apinorum TaxID=1218495 RepID=UPI000AE59BC1|nr:hypothetical protein [Apilactobacillus apinorum]